ncbi:MAG: hypothetical protein V3U11_12060 [Planctomycetota bacterium]
MTAGDRLEIVTLVGGG